MRAGGGVAGGGEHRIDGIAAGMGEVIAAHAVVFLEVADDGLDRSPPFELAIDLRGDAVLLALDQCTVLVCGIISGGGSSIGKLHTNFGGKPSVPGSTIVTNPDRANSPKSTSKDSTGRPVRSATPAWDDSSHASSGVLASINKKWNAKALHSSLRSVFAMVTAIL